MARLLIKDGCEEPRAFELRLGVNRFGRHPDCEFPIDHPTISSLHCEMVLTNNGVLLRDCDSTNGTYINGKPVTEASLRSGQTVRLGDVEIFIETTDARIAIPEIERQVEPPPILLPDGTILCRRHPDACATHRCTHCHEILCEGCVRRLRRRGGKTLKLCALCSHAVEPLVPERRKRRSFLSILTETIKLPFLSNKRTS